MSDIQISRAPLVLRETIWQAKLATYEVHRQHQPYAFPGGVLDLRKVVFDRKFDENQGPDLYTNGAIFVAHLGSDFCGYIELGGLPPRVAAPPPCMDIQDIWVDPSFRNQGIGRALLRHVTALAEAQDWDNLTADVRPWNDYSLRLFQAAGFSRQSETLRFGPERQARDWRLLPAGSRTGQGQALFRLAAPVAMFLAGLVIGLHN